MLPPPLRPLVPLSALALFGWCWYTFKKRRRNLKEQVKEIKTGPTASMEECLVEHKAAISEDRPTAQDLKPVCHVHAQKTQEKESSSSYKELTLDLKVSNCSQVSSTMKEKLPVLPKASVTNTSTRPEPEGKVSEAQASALLAENMETEMDKNAEPSKGNQDFTAGEVSTSWPESDANSSVQPFCPKGQGVPNMPESNSDEELEWTSYSLVQKSIHAAVEEILRSGDVILKRENDEEPKEAEKSEAQDLSVKALQTDYGSPTYTVEKNEFSDDSLDLGLSQTSPAGEDFGDVLKRNSQEVVKEAKSEVQNLRVKALQKDYGALTHTVEKNVFSDENLCEQGFSPSASQAGEDSGCHSEDGAGAEETTIIGELWSGLSEEGPYPPVLVTSESKTPNVLAKTNGEHLRQKADVSKGANDDGTCMNEESRVSSCQTTQFSSSALTLWDIEVPAHLVGRLIGKQGKHVAFLKQNSGAKIYVSPLPYTHEFQICHIKGSKVQVENALALIRKKFKDLDLTNRQRHAQPVSLPSLPITSWLLLPQDCTVEVIVPRVETANYLFVQQHTHPTYYALSSLNEQMLFCYSRPGCPSLPTPVEAGVVCAAPSADGVWWRAQVIQHYKDTDTVQIRYVDYGGYVTVNLSALRQIRSDFVALPFQGSEVMLENIAPLPGKEEFSLEAKEALEELTQGVPLIIKVTGSQSGLPLVHMWRQAREEVISVNGLLVERGLCSWLDSH